MILLLSLLPSTFNSIICIIIFGYMWLKPGPQADGPSSPHGFQDTVNLTSRVFAPANTLLCHYNKRLDWCFNLPLKLLRSNFRKQDRFSLRWHVDIRIALSLHVKGFLMSSYLLRIEKIFEACPVQGLKMLTCVAKEVPARVIDGATDLKALHLLMTPDRMHTQLRRSTSYVDLTALVLCLFPLQYGCMMPSW